MSSTTSFQIVRIASVFLLLFIGATLTGPMPCLSETNGVRFQGDIPKKAMAAARRVESVSATATIPMIITLPLRNQEALKTFIRRVSDPADPLYGHFLTPREFTEKFGPTQADYDAVAAYVLRQGFKITATHPNRTLINISASAAAVETAFKLRLNMYRTPQGRRFYAPDSGPEVPASIASRISGVIGLDNATRWHPHSYFVSAADAALRMPNQIGHGQGGGLTPADIEKAYNLTGVSAKGAGQVLGILDFAGYNASDISEYTNYYNLPAVLLQDVHIDGFSPDPQNDTSEATLDIELQIALAPDVKKIVIYEAPNSDVGVVHAFNKIATDNLATQISTSWGSSELQTSQTVLDGENAALQQMAAQGQSFFSSTGDRGAYDDTSDPTLLSVDDPGSQPYIVGTGGTKLFLYSDGTYNYESTWNTNGTADAGAGGGGVSAVWRIPTWQQGIGSAASSAMRNVPDVSLDADLDNGYSIYYDGGWWVFGGTSCAAPLWAAFTARVNQVRAENGMPVLGFANPLLYAIAASPKYDTDFHDIENGTDNLYYVAGTGYDNATGWGSFNGAHLLADLAQPVDPVTPATPADFAATAGDGRVNLSWRASTGAASYNVYRGTAPGGEGITPIRTGITETAYTDTTVTNGVTYYYQVAAANTSGTSPLSVEVSAAPLAAPKLSATGGDGKVNLSWSASAGATGYNLYRATAPGQEGNTPIQAGITATTYTDTAVTNGVTYYYQVAATNDSGTSSLSKEASATAQVQQSGGGGGGGCFIGIATGK